MNIKDLKVKKIDYKTAMDLVVEKHYLKRKCSCSLAFGLFISEDNNTDLFNKETIVGVIVFGKTL